ncbi:hypothetical protein B4U80_04375 [Leptotrombidium deliense]|uniref:Uncharacterized protein n=1 Tax=Leptotrombidium deliense TaxID=299467 RepID=A0A443SN53_9ACAR|nr:hypothetical protein B4U80_04375 [Leptotrombidium deliense]
MYLDGVQSMENDAWDREITDGEKYMLRDEPSGGTYGIAREGHVTLSLEPRRTPEGDVFNDRCQSDSGSTISSNAHNAQDNYKRLPRYLLPPSAILKEPSVVILNEDESIMTTETPLINGLYFPQYTNNVSVQYECRLDHN